MPSVVPQASSLGSRRLYEALFQHVFVAGVSVLAKDVRAYCLATHYRSGSQIDGALELLVNIGILTVDGDYMKPDEDFLQVAKGRGIAVATSIRLIERLAASGEIGDLFPAGSITWGAAQDDLNIHLSQIPFGSLAVVGLLRSLGVLLDLEEATVLLKVQEPFSQALQTAVSLSSKSKRIFKVLTPEQLEHLQEAQVKQGMRAEEYVLQLERKRLEGHRQIQLVRRISLSNTAAGYDIESFEGPESFMPDRFIEVKSYKGEEHFFLSLGELEAARELGDRYHLYLVDVERLDSSYYLPAVIRNPANALFDQCSSWLATAVTFEICRKRPAKI